MEAMASLFACRLQHGHAQVFRGQGNATIATLLVYCRVSCPSCTSPMCAVGTCMVTTKRFLVPASNWPVIMRAVPGCDSEVDGVATGIGHASPLAQSHAQATGTGKDLLGILQIFVENVAKCGQVLKIRVVSHAVVGQRGHEGLIKAQAHANGGDNGGVLAKAGGNFGEFLGIHNTDIGLTVRQQ